MFVGVFRKNFVSYPFAGISLEPETWYETIIAVDKNAKFLIYQWNPENPKQYHQFKSIISNKWTGQVWNFVANMDQEGEICFDNFSKITFSEMK
jgi:hypothetical protein